jgi:predicted RNA-binding protein with PUA-like domain
MNYWLIKSDPETYSFERMKKDKKTHWDGVHNYAARNHMKAMKKGDLVFFYESMNGEPSIVGIVKVGKEHYQDPTTTESWVWVDVEYGEPLSKPVTLAQVKANKKLAQMALVRISRLSVQPVSKEEWDEVMKMSK